MAPGSMLMTECYSTMGRTTGQHLDHLRRQLGVGTDPAYDYTAMMELQKSLTQKRDRKEEDVDPAALEALQQALEDARGAAEGSSSSAAHARQASCPSKPGRSSRSFLAPSRREAAKSDAESRYRAPPVGTYRPRTDLVAPRQKAANFACRPPTKSWKTVNVEKEMAELQAESKSVEHLLKRSVSVEFLDEVPERMRRRYAGVGFEKQSARPDLVKQGGIVYHENTFTEGVLDGDLACSTSLRNPTYDFAKVSTVETKPRETFFQPGQYEVESGLSLTRPKNLVKNLPFRKQTKRQDMKEAVGLFEIKARPGDNLPDRSMSRSCPALSSQPRLNVANFDKYTDRPPLGEPEKSYHFSEDAETEQAVLQHELKHDQLDAAKVTWSKTRAARRFDKNVKREDHHKIQRGYANNVLMQMAKENTARGSDLSVELLDGIGDSPNLRPRVVSPNFKHMASKEPGQGRYRARPARGRDLDNGLRFERDARSGDGRPVAEALSPQMTSITQKRRARTYTELQTDLSQL